MLGAELICAVLLVSGPLSAPSQPAVAQPTPMSAPAVAASATETVTTPDGRVTHLIDLAASNSAFLDRIAAEMPGATDAVTAFWGPAWRPDITVVVAGSADQFSTLAAGGVDVAATTTAERIMFSPAAATMSDTDLRIVLRHELFHYAARAQTAADAPVWLTEGVADYVGRPPAATPVTSPRTLPTDAELSTPGPGRSAAYDRAWQFASYIAAVHGADTLRALYLAACGPGHTDIATAVRATVGTDLPDVLAADR